MSNLHDSKESGRASKMNSVDEMQANFPDQHWTDVCYNANKVRIVDLEDQVGSALAKLQSQHLLLRKSPMMMSNPSIVRPTSTQFESYHFTDEDKTRKSLISQ